MATIRKAGNASDRSSSGIFRRFCAISTPTIINIGLIAAFGIMEIHGMTSSVARNSNPAVIAVRSEEHTSELQSRFDLVCRLLLEKKKKDSKELVIEVFDSRA